MFLLRAVNDRAVGSEGVNGWLSNVLMAVVVTVTMVLGVSNVLRVASVAAGVPAPQDSLLLAAGPAVAAGLAYPVTRGLLRRRSHRAL